MTSDQAVLVRDSFARVVPIAPQAAALFYGRLFELDPTLRPLFRNDMGEQGRKLMAMIATAVAHVDDLSAVVPAVRALGARHVAYGVRPEHYATVGAALLWTLEQGLREEGFTPACREAWATLYGTVAEVMQSGS